MSYPVVGNVIEVPINIVSADTGLPIDPDTLLCTVTAPDGSQQTFTYPDVAHLTRQAEGKFLLAWTGDPAGRWFWKATSTGAGEGVGDGYVDVRDLYSGPGVLLDQLKGYLSIQKTSEDDVLIRMLAAVTLMIERFIGIAMTPSPPLSADGSDSEDPVSITVPVSSSAASSWAFTGTLATRPRWVGSGPAGLTVTIPHARQITEVKLNADSDPITEVAIGADGPGYWTETDPRLDGTFYRRLVIVGASDPVTSITITGRFGVYPGPPDILDAILTMTARRYKEREARWGDSVQLQDGSAVSYFRQWPLSVRSTLDSYLEIGV